MALNENIKKYRKMAYLTQKDLAYKSGLSFSMISKLEIGEQTNPSFETIRKIADVLRVSPGELLNNQTSIEDQIDEYIEYRRGLNKTNFNCIAVNEAKTQEDPCVDLNFKKKLQAINEIPMPSVYTNSEYPYTNSEYPDYLEKSPELRKLFSVLRNATRDEIIQVTRLLESVKASHNP